MTFEELLAQSTANQSPQKLMKTPRAKFRFTLKKEVGFSLKATLKT